MPVLTLLLLVLAGVGELGRKIPILLRLYILLRDNLSLLITSR